MPLTQEFWDNLSQKTDRELYDLLAHAEDYELEALEAARQELRKRDLPPEDAKRLEAAVQVQVIAENARTQEPLSWPIRIAIFLFCAGLPGILLALHYDRKGFKRKSSECWMLMMISIAAHVIAGALLSL